ncbi:MAG TPA: hypothetical protein PK916_15880 [Bacteroidota bacterium]|nr:hypothetical protein [Bacteroidota bacterium]
MNSRIVMKNLLLAALSLILSLVLLSACSDQNDIASGPSQESVGALNKDAKGLERAMEVQTRNTERFLAKKGIVGTGTGIAEDGTPTIVIFTETQQGKGVIPENIEGIPVREEVVGAVEPLSVKGGGQPTATKKPGTGTSTSTTTYSTTSRWPRPVPIGVSTSNWYDCGAATIGVRVRRGDAFFALSCNHVFSRLNAAAVGEKILQPGRSDVSCTQTLTDEIGVLADFEPIIFSTMADNYMDAAMISTTTAQIDNSTPANGYGVPSSTPATAYVGMPVQKYGRTTGLTKGKVSAINVIIGINYAQGAARFVNQIAVQPARKGGDFALAGDSGSLIVTDGDSAQPVALLFGKSSTTIFGTPIQTVLTRFNVTIDGK